MVDVSRLVLRQLAELAEPKRGIPGSGFTAQPRPIVEPPEEDPQRRGLELVEPRVVADELEVDLVARTVEAQHPHAVAERFVGDRDEAAVAEPEEVLRGIEAERRRDARSRDFRRAERLRRILDDRNAQVRELFQLRG